MTESSGGRATFNWADYVVLGAVLSFSSVIGVFYAFRGRRQRTTNDFIAASRQMGCIPVAMSLLASLFTGIYIQGMVSEVYFRGAMAPLTAPIPLFITALMAGRIFLPAFYKLRLRSVYQYLEMRFNITVRNCCLIIGYLYMILHAGIATFAACLVLTTVSDMNFLTAVIVLSGVCTFYTAIGGIKAVVWADAFQMFLIYSPLFAAVGVACAKVGFGDVWKIGVEEGRLDVFNLSFDPTEYLTFWCAVVGGIFTWMPSMCVLQYQVQRYNTCKDEKTANIAMSLFTGACLVIVVFSALAGLSVFALFVNCDPFATGTIRFRDELLPYFMLESFSHIPGLPGLLVSGLCSAALSTVSSVINSIVTMTGEHVVTKIWKTMPDSTYLLITKLLAVFFGLLNIGMTYFMSSLGAIVPTLIGLIGITSGPVMGVFLLGFMFPKCNSKGALVGFIVGSLLGLWIFIGSIIYQKPPDDLPLSVEGCPADLVTGGFPDDNATTGWYSDGTVTGLPGTGVVGASVYGLLNSTSSTSGLTDVTQAINATAIPDNENVLVLYLISRWWYPTITTCTVLVTGILVSIITGVNDPSLMDQTLFVNWHSLFCCCWKRRTHRELQNEKEFPSSDDEKAAAVPLQSSDVSSSNVITTV